MNTCPVDNWLMILQSLVKSGRINLCTLGSVGDKIKLVLDLIDLELYGDAKIAILPDTPVVNNGVMDLYGNRVLKLLRHVVRATKFSVPNKSVDAFAKPTWRSCLFHHCFHFSKMRRIRLTKERTITDQTMWKVLLTFPECCVGKFMPA